LKKLLRSGARKGNGTIEDERDQIESSMEMQEARSSVIDKTQQNKAIFHAGQQRENKKHRRKHKSRKQRQRKERLDRERNKERKMKKEKHERRRGSGTVKQCANMFLNLAFTITDNIPQLV